MNKITFSGRGYGKTLKADKELLKQWPNGTIVFANHNDVRYSEEADAEEI